MKNPVSKKAISNKTAEERFRRKRLEGLKSMHGRMKVRDFSAELRRMELKGIAELGLNKH